MKPKDRKYPSIDEQYQYQLQLREVVCETYPQRPATRLGSERDFARRAAALEPVSDQVCKPTVTLH